MQFSVYKNRRFGKVWQQKQLLDLYFVKCFDFGNIFARKIGDFDPKYGNLSRKNNQNIGFQEIFFVTILTLTAGG
jgi:hypothetical protein